MEKLCKNCEYFDGGALGADNQPREFHGDSGN